MLVTGQSPEAINRIMAGKATFEDEQVAIRRFLARSEKLGKPPVFYKTLEEALEVARNRTNEQKGSPRNPFTAVGQ
jgi:hypothetical protein